MQEASAAKGLFSPLSWLPLQYTHSPTPVSLPSGLLSFLTINEPCLTSCTFLGAAAVSLSSLCAPWLPAQSLNTVGAHTIFGGLICSRRLRLHALLLAQYGGHLQLKKEVEGYFLYGPSLCRVRAVSHSRTSAVPRLSPEAQTRAVSHKGQGYRCHLAVIRVRP